MDQNSQISWKLITAYAAEIKEDLQKLIRQARRCKTYVSEGGIGMINVSRFEETMGELASKKSQDTPQRRIASTSKSISETNSVGLLRGQISRLRKIITGLEKRLDDIPNRLERESDVFVRAALSKEFDAKGKRLNKNRETLRAAEDRLAELAEEAEKDAARIIGSAKSGSKE